CSPSGDRRRRRLWEALPSSRLRWTSGKSYYTRRRPKARLRWRRSARSARRQERCSGSSPGPRPGVRRPTRTPKRSPFASGATGREWRRLTRSSYTALYYHRVAGEGKPGQERIDISPERFARQLRLLRRLGLRALSADEVVAFHSDPDTVLPRRAYAVTADDG